MAQESPGYPGLFFRLLIRKAAEYANEAEWKQPAYRLGAKLHPLTIEQNALTSFKSRTTLVPAYANTIGPGVFLHADWAITLACGAQCPYVPTTVEDWDIPDPAGLPLEEIAFFIVIPLASILTFESVRVVRNRGRAPADRPARVER